MPPALALLFAPSNHPAVPRRPYRPSGFVLGSMAVDRERLKWAETVPRRLRGLTFFSLAECNAAIREMRMRMNERPMRRLGSSRRRLFGTIERAQLH